MSSSIRVFGRKLLTYLALPTVLIFTGGSSPFAQADADGSSGSSGTLSKLVATTGNVTVTLDRAQLGDVTRDASPATLEFQVGADSWFTTLVFNDEFRTAEGGSLNLVPANGVTAPAALATSFHQLVLEKLQPGEQYEFVLRDARTGFIYFNVDRFEYKYDAASRTLQLQNARLLFSSEFAKQLGRAAEASPEAGSVAFTARMYPLEVTELRNGQIVGTKMPAAPNPEVGTNPGPDVIVGDLPSMVQSGSSGTNVGLAIATTSCNAGVVDLNWFAMPNTDHPVIPQNVYRMSANADRIEQIGQGWMKHAFTALTQNVCSLGCNGTGGTHLGSGCSDPYDTSLNGSQTGIGSRAWVNPFTGVFPGGNDVNGQPTARDHTGHTHNGTTHRVLVAQSDLSTAANPGATYYGEAEYVTPHEYAWCQANPGQCNMYNNASYRQFTVNGTTTFTFSPAAATVRTRAAVFAWTGATIAQMEPAPGQDGIGFMAYKVTGPTNGMYHYEYAIFNQNMDRGIQSFSVPLSCGANLTNVGFHAPLNHPGIAYDGTPNSAGYSNTPWAVAQSASTISWSSETLAQNPNANALRWGTLYNFRFDSPQPPTAASATVGFYKTGSPMTVSIQAPSAACAPLQVVTGVSRHSHGSAGNFDLPLNMTGSPTIESRSGGPSGDHTLIFSFNNNVVSGNANVSGGGSVNGSPSFSGNTMTVNLTGVSDSQVPTITLTGVTDSFSQTMPDTAVSVGFLIGDVSGDGSVNAGDVLATRGRAGQPISSTNFGSDINTDGDLNSGDVTIVRSSSGHSIGGAARGN